MSNIKKLIHFNSSILSFISIFAGLISIIYIFIQYLELNTKYSFILIGTIASILGALISFLFSYITSKKAKAKVFISYSNNDKEFVEKLISELNKRNIQSISVENNINIGDNIQKILANQILQTNLVIPILSENYIKSEWTKKELEFAQENGKIILPVLKEKIKLPNKIENLKFADFTENYNEALNQLIKTIEMKYQHQRITNRST